MHRGVADKYCECVGEYSADAHVSASHEPAELSWGMLREMRSHPPAMATKPDRRRVFSAALEQSEQLFSAAASVGVATKPILCFYGLSQAGRAIAAAHGDSAWRLRGHGITMLNESSSSPSVAALVVRSHDGGSFGKMVQILGSSSLPYPARLGDLWPLLVGTRHPVPGGSDDRPLTLSLHGLDDPSEISMARVGNLPGRFAAAVVPQPAFVSSLGADYSPQAEALDRYLSRYPTLSPRVPFTANSRPIGMHLDGDGTCSVVFRWVSSPGDEGQVPDPAGIRVGDGWLVYPALDAGGRPVHPLVLWWAVLFGLSMLARYEPERWDAITDVNTSADAVPTEHLLREALVAVPALVLQALSRRST